VVQLTSIRECLLLIKELEYLLLGGDCCGHGRNVAFAGLPLYLRAFCAWLLPVDCELYALEAKLISCGGIECSRRRLVQGASPRCLYAPRLHD
jgi:hypothetical protein